MFCMFTLLTVDLYFTYFSAYGCSLASVLSPSWSIFVSLGSTWRVTCLTAGFLRPAWLSPDCYFWHGGHYLFSIYLLNRQAAWHMPPTASYETRETQNLICSCPFKPWIFHLFFASFWSESWCVISSLHSPYYKCLNIYCAVRISPYLGACCPLPPAFSDLALDLVYAT